MRVIAVLSILVTPVAALQSSKSLLPCRRLPSTTILRQERSANKIRLRQEHRGVEDTDTTIDFTRHSAFQPFVALTRSSSSSKRSGSPSLASDQSSSWIAPLTSVVAALLLTWGGPAVVSSALALSDYEGGGAELAELPPPYIPVIFGLGLLAGVGLLTSSLGNVMDEEASLGLQSGAKAKKEMERGRSSFFKKR